MNKQTVLIFISLHAQEEEEEEEGKEMHRTERAKSCLRKQFFEKKQQQ